MFSRNNAKTTSSKTMIQPSNSRYSNSQKTQGSVAGEKSRELRRNVIPPRACTRDRKSTHAMRNNAPPGGQSARCSRSAPRSAPRKARVAVHTSLGSSAARTPADHRNPTGVIPERRIHPTHFILQQSKDSTCVVRALPAIPIRWQLHEDGRRKSVRCAHNTPRRSCGRVLVENRERGNNGGET